jgi:hypothetical protein
VSAATEAKERIPAALTNIFFFFSFFVEDEQK